MLWTLLLLDINYAQRMHDVWQKPVYNSFKPHDSCGCIIFLELQYSFIPLCLITLSQRATYYIGILYIFVHAYRWFHFSLVHFVRYKIFIFFLKLFPSYFIFNLNVDLIISFLLLTSNPFHSFLPLVFVP